MGGMAGKPEITLQYLQQHLTIGRSTETDVRNLLGEPNSQDTNTSGNDTWYYYPQDTSIGSKLGELSSLAGMIPGVGSALSYASTANSTADTAGSLMNSGKLKAEQIPIYFKHSILSGFSVNTRKQ
jgi:outer membrane protein assembly factor BamE (lipoprotein component of BamABCDE complex)